MLHRFSACRNRLWAATAHITGGGQRRGSAADPGVAASRYGTWRRGQGRRM